MTEQNDTSTSITISNICKSYKEHIAPYTSFGYGWCFIEDYDKPIINPYLLELFPEIDDISNINFNIIRPYIKSGLRPIWHIDIDGTRIGWFESINHAANVLKVSQSNIANILINKNNLCLGHSFEYMTYEEIVNPRLDYIKIIPKIIKDVLKLDNNIIMKSFVKDLLKQNKDSKGIFYIKTRPIIRLSLDNDILDYFPSVSDAYNKLKMNRGCIEEVLKGNNKTAGGFVFRYMTIEEMSD